MELYHGSNVKVIVPEIRENIRALDFETRFVKGFFYKTVFNIYFLC